MWIVYAVKCKTADVSPCCFTHEYEKALDALDDYAIAKFRLKVPDYPTDKDPLDGDGDDGDYKLEFDKGHVTRDGDFERVNLVKKKDGVVAHYFQLGHADKYIDDYIAERTPAVVELENDAKMDVMQDVLADYEDDDDATHRE